MAEVAMFARRGRRRRQDAPENHATSQYDHEK